MRTIVDKNLSLLCVLSFLMLMILGLITVPFACATDLDGTIPGPSMTLQAPLTDANSFVLIAKGPTHVVTNCEDLQTKYIAASCCTAKTTNSGKGGKGGNGGMCTTLYNKILVACNYEPTCP
jgi:hypothetical protein